MKTFKKLISLFACAFALTPMLIACDDDTATTTGAPQGLYLTNYFLDEPHFGDVDYCCFYINYYYTGRESLNYLQLFLYGKDEPESIDAVYINGATSKYTSLVYGSVVTFSYRFEMPTTGNNDNSTLRMELRAKVKNQNNEQLLASASFRYGDIVSRCLAASKK